MITHQLPGHQYNRTMDGSHRICAIEKYLKTREMTEGNDFEESRIKT